MPSNLLYLFERLSLNALQNCINAMSGQTYLNDTIFYLGSMQKSVEKMEDFTNAVLMSKFVNILTVFCVIFFKYQKCFSNKMAPVYTDHNS